jgi:hypothetical protein
MLEKFPKGSGAIAPHRPRRRSAMVEGRIVEAPEDRGGNCARRRSRAPHRQLSLDSLRCRVTVIMDPRRAPKIALYEREACQDLSFRCGTIRSPCAQPPCAPVSSGDGTLSQVNWIEVRRVLREVSQLCPAGLNCLLHAGDVGAGDVVDDDDVPPKSRGGTLFHLARNAWPFMAPLD